MSAAVFLSILLHCGLLLPAARAFTAIGSRRQSCAARGTILRAAEFDPFSAPRGPRERGPGPPQESADLFGDRPNEPARAPQGDGPPEDDEEQGIVRGARILGAGVGGFSGNSLWSGFTRTGLAKCSPFDLASCATSDSTAATRAALAPTATNTDDMDFPFANILRNPTSILPQEWNLPGRKYLDDLPDEEASQAVAPVPAPVQAPISVPAPVQAPSPGLDRAAADFAKGALESPDEQLARLREELSRLQETFSSSVAPLGVAPASASEPGPLVLEHSSHSFEYSLLESGAGFAAVADGEALASGGLLATVLCGALGALVFEYVATNREPPVPDPLFSGFYSSIHSTVRTASRYTNVAATKVLDLAGPTVAKAIESVRGRLGG